MNSVCRIANRPASLEYQGALSFCNYFFAILTFFLFFSQNSYAQSLFENTTFGARAGVNLSKINSNDLTKVITSSTTDNYEAKAMFKPGLQLGFVAETHTDFLDVVVQTSFLFYQMGGTWEHVFNEPMRKIEQKTEITLNYFQIPVNIQYQLELGAVSLLVQAGPYIGIGFEACRRYLDLKLDAKIKTETTTTFAGNPENYSSKDIFKHSVIDFGFGAGAGILLFDRFQLVAGYNLGITNILIGANGKNAGISADLTYMFGK